MTQSPLDRARERIEAFRATDAALVLARLSVDDDTVERHAASVARRALGTGENRADLEDARSLHLLEPGLEALLIPHLADAARAESLERAGVSLWVSADTTTTYEGQAYGTVDLVRGALRAGASETLPRIRAALSSLDTGRSARRDALDAGDDAADRVLRRGPLSPDATPADLPERCAAFLEETDDVCIELGARLVHACAGAGRDPAARLLEALHGAREPFDWRASGHAQAVTDLLKPLALDGVLSAKVRLEKHSCLTLEAPVLVTNGVAIVYAAPIELGVLSRLLIVESSLRGVALSLVSSLALESRVAASGSSLARTVAATLASALAQPEVLTRSLGLESSAARASALSGTLALLLSARIRATRVIASRERPADDDARERGGRALGLDEPVPTTELAYTSTATRPELEAAARASLGALAAGAALRERFDEDWGRNPRIEHLVRAACAYGPTLSAERWLAELGGRPEDASRFGREIAGAG